MTREVTAVRVHHVVEDLIDMGRRHPGDRDILIADCRFTARSCASPSPIPGAGPMP